MEDAKLLFMIAQQVLISRPIMMPLARQISTFPRARCVLYTTQGPAGSTVYTAYSDRASVGVLTTASSEHYKHHSA